MWEGSNFPGQVPLLPVLRHPRKQEPPGLRHRAAPSVYGGGMKTITRLLGDPTFMRRFAGWQVVFWTVLIPVSAIFGWVEDVGFISYLSEIALVLSALAWWQAGRVEETQDQDADVQDVLDWLEKNFGKGGDKTP